MKKNYVYLALLLIGTVAMTFIFSNMYKKESTDTSYLYNKLNRITAEEFSEYMIENPDTIIYIVDKENSENYKFEKKFMSKLEKLGLIENVVCLEKQEISSSLEKKLEDDYSYIYNEKVLPIIIVINDNKIIGTSVVTENSNVDTIIDYGVFE